MSCPLTAAVYRLPLDSVVNAKPNGQLADNKVVGNFKLIAIYYYNIQ